VAKTLKNLNKKTSRDFSLFYLGVIIIFSLLILLFLNFLFNKYFNQDYLNNSTVKNKISFKLKKVIKPAKVASASAQATKSATLSIPKNFGRTVNVPIFYYHYIGNNPNPADKIRDTLSVTPDKFESQMSLLASNGYNAISLDSLYAALKGGLLPPKPVALTFDDGYIDFYLNAYPILRKYNLHATVFIPTGLVGQGYYLNWSQIKEMDASNLISFEAHSVNHVNLASLNQDQVKFQVFQSKQVLESQLGKPINFFAYPYGGSNEMVWQVVKQAGFLAALGTWGSSIESEGTIFDMPRIRVSSSWSGEDFLKRF